MEEILTLAGEISGAEEREQGLLASLCAAACQRWEHRLQPDIAPEDCGAAFPCAVAFSAAADLVEGRCGSAVSSFTAGMISVQEMNAAERSKDAASLRQTAERLMAPYVEMDDFSFKGVRG